MSLMALFETVDMLDRWMRDKLSAWQIWLFDNRRVSTRIICNSFLFPHYLNPKSNPFYLCSTAINLKEEKEAHETANNIQGGGGGDVAGDGNRELS